ncbi:MAG TPA: ATP-dependent DNA helicase RecG [Candidatus Polarisedimenticolia bacterium]|nr:ATP-dependent DNA helicase RecG [Candidatus Polarisedimenticolia bacterium]
MPPLTIDAPLDTVRGLGPQRAKALREAGIATVEDLLLHLPFRYEDRTAFLPIASLMPGVRGTVRGQIRSAALRRTRVRGFSLFEALVEDGSGTIRVVFFNQPWLRTHLVRGREVILYGEVKPSRAGRRGLALESPQIEIPEKDGEAEGIHMGRVVPIHPRLPGLSPRAVRTLVHRLLRELPELLPEPLPPGVAERRGLPPRGEALRAVHFPDAGTDALLLETRSTPAQRRLIFEEFFFLQLGFALQRAASDAGGRGAGPILQVDDPLRERLRSVLPFRLTAAQRRVLAEIAADLLSPRPMNRLLQGDVGCGKTMVALLAALLVAENGLQAAFMAPTEILAEQHHRLFTRLLQGRGQPVGLLTASVTGSARRQVLAGLASGALKIVVGTHALAEEEVRFQALRLVIIDEQHRFGVAQRARLRAKGDRPDVLVMTATPIPRSLALTLYGDLDVSVIDALPPGRRPVLTVVREATGRPRVHEFLRRQVAEGRQVFVVVPVIEESERGDLQAAASLRDRLQKDVFPGRPVGLLHGRLPAAERDEVMGEFAGGRLPVLVATTVIEVGIDVPNASVMVIEQADRFGLSQLHQLRGRVGRGGHESYCILVAGEQATDDARRRLQVMVDTSDGFEVARRDLELRGPGQFLGTKQSGIPDLRLGDLVRDRELLEDAREAAHAVVADTRAGRAPAVLTAHLERRWGSRLGMIQVG